MFGAQTIEGIKVLDRIIIKSERQNGQADCDADKMFTVVVTTGTRKTLTSVSSISTMSDRGRCTSQQLRSDTGE